jgi:tetratricopeptide (TPR) repeat protein
VPAPGADLRLLLAEAHLRAGDAAAAATALERELAGDSPPVPVYVLAAYARIKAGELARAAEIAEDGMRRHPDSEIESVYLTLPPPVLAERTALRLKALQAATAPDVRELVALARVLIDVDPTRKTRALAIARTLVAQALAIDPANASAQHQQARILREQDIPASIEAWTRALAMRPSDELALQIHTQLAKARQAVSDASGADAAFAAALAVNRRLSPRVPEPALEYVRFLRDERRAAEADALLAEVIGWNPWSPVARAERARQHDAAEDWPRVVTEGEFVLRTAGDHDDLRRVAHLLLAKAYYRLKQPEKARAHAEWLKGHP